MAFQFYTYQAGRWEKLAQIKIDENNQSGLSDPILEKFKLGEKMAETEKSNLLVIANKLINEIANLIDRKYSIEFPYTLNVLFWFDFNLKDHNCYQQLVKQFFSKVSPESEKSCSAFTPVLNLGTFDFYEDFLKLSHDHGSIGNDIGKEIFRYNLKNEKNIRKHEIVKYFRFLDSSIWSRYLYLGSEYFKTSLELLLFKYYAKHFGNKLYHTAVAHEYIDLQARLLLESKIQDFGSGGGHSKSIIPFSFQSETELISYTAANQRKLLALFPENRSTMDEHKIRLFLWDDKATEDLNSIADSVSCSGDTKDSSKEKILTAILEDFLPLHGDKKKISPISSELFRIITGSNANNESVDIILSDFLLNTKAKPDENQLSTDHFLSWLAGTNNDDSFLISSKIKNKLWIFPVSSFNLAMSDKFAQLGFEYFSKDWVMSDGADFINTPNAFRYKFSEFLLHLIEETGGGLFKLANKPENSFKSLCEFLAGFKNNNGSESEKSKLDQEFFRKIYPDIVHINQHYLELFKVNRKGYISWALRNIFNGAEPYFMEHLVHLAYLLAFASRVQANQMLEELKFVLEFWPQYDSKGNRDDFRTAIYGFISDFLN